MEHLAKIDYVTSVLQCAIDYVTLAIALQKARHVLVQTETRY